MKLIDIYKDELVASSFNDCFSSVLPGYFLAEDETYVLFKLIGDNGFYHYLVRKDNINTISRNSRVVKEKRILIEEFNKLELNNSIFQITELDIKEDDAFNHTIAQVIDKKIPVRVTMVDSETQIEGLITEINDAFVELQSFDKRTLLKIDEIEEWIIDHFDDRVFFLVSEKLGYQY